MLAAQGEANGALLARSPAKMHAHVLLHRQDGRMDYSSIRNRVDEIHESYMEDISSDEYAQAHAAAIEQLDAEDVDVDELQQTLRDLVDATRSAATEAKVSDPQRYLADDGPSEANWEVEVEALEADAERLSSPQLSSLDDADGLDHEEAEHDAAGIEL
jgi:hypothetical protein